MPKALTNWKQESILKKLHMEAAKSEIPLMHPGASPCAKKQPPKCCWQGHGHRGIAARIRRSSLQGRNPPQTEGQKQILWGIPGAHWE